uniref:Uncharacterized protein n=1 Tax=Haptolina ericina TaxID=156174 RepID=A0A7S3AFH8_9EUKA|mmetsp:Transcript_13004/g.29690  ORF Transcript_13004/g.29690 Transcript_13004/m.29690 type:complete len:123 (+) Transcript_13004:389-757(+)
MTTFPKGYPGDYDLPHDLEMRAYSERGWCCTETCWAQLFKPFDMSLDVGLYSRSSKRWVDIKRECAQGVRLLPQLPVALEAVLAEKKFTNGKDDRPLTAQLYRDAFNSQMSQASVLRYNNLG